MDGPLAGVRIIDLTTMISGPFATMMLADQGAEVIKVEVPGSGDHVRSLGYRRNGLSAMFLNVNRNKRSLTINLKNPAGLELFRKLAATADIVVQNFRPGVAERLGVGEAQLRAELPKLIYVSISGFGAKGPYAQKPTYDPVIQALSGMTSIQAGSDDAHPRLVRTILPDKLAAVTTAQAIAAALYAREKTGTGQHVTLSMLDAMLAFLWASDMGAHTFADEAGSKDTAASFIDLIYETKNGHMTVSVMNNKEWAALVATLEKPEWLNDPRFRTPALRDQHVNERLTLIQAELRHQTTDTWLERFEAAGVPCAPALTRRQVVDHPQVIASGTIVEFDHPEAGRLRQARAAAQFAATPTSLRTGAPRLGEHNYHILGELGLSAQAIDRLRAHNVIGSEEPLPALYDELRLSGTYPLPATQQR
jgi:crotonobetainyl-CoA:carnitine CoA-transferase CaiB-like acyl-CoA transferase